jgi:Protein of unknown function (DUF2844)
LKKQLKPAPFCRFLRAFVATVVVTAASSAFAGLGEDASSVLADQARVHGTLRSTQSQNFTMHEIQEPNGTILHEYVSATGKVFAVAWHGPWLPDMRQLLAGYFDQYRQGQQAQASQHVIRRPLRIEQPGLVVESGGHMRAFAGRAYIPDMMPAGVTPDQIQ